MLGFYSVKIGCQRISTGIRNRETSNINALYSDSIPNYLETYQSFKDAVARVSQDNVRKGAKRVAGLPERKFDPDELINFACKNT